MILISEVRDESLDENGGGGDEIEKCLSSVWKGELMGIGSGSDF